jgi:hypothetical protein
MNLAANIRNGRPHDYRKPERTPEYKAPTPSRDAYSASFDLGKNSPVTPAPDECYPQFRDDKASTCNDTKEGWCRGMGSQSPHPHFDSGPSGNRYSRK